MVVTVRNWLKPNWPEVIEPPVPEAAAERRRTPSNPGTTGTANYLLERRAVLDRTLGVEGGSAMSRIMRHNPPIPMALVMIASPPTRERFLKLLGNANIEVEQASTVAEALTNLAARVHALLFTDSLDLIREARQLHTGAATHMVFIGSADQTGVVLRAGANDCMPEQGRGQEFWAQLTTATRIVSLAASLQLALTDNRILSTIDELTRCGSRRFFEHEFPREVERAARLGRPLALVMCDIDHFKSVNDTYGHQVGDEVLKEFADRVNQVLRTGEDWVARIGGEEFAVVLPEASMEQALTISGRLMEQIRAVPFHTSVGDLRVTASFGLCSLSGVRRRSTGLPQAIVGVADAALYESKRNGRDRLTTTAYAGES